MTRFFAKFTNNQKDFNEFQKNNNKVNSNNPLVSISYDY